MADIIFSCMSSDKRLNAKVLRTVEKFKKKYPDNEKAVFGQSVTEIFRFIGVDIHNHHTPYYGIIMDFISNMVEQTMWNKIDIVKYDKIVNKEKL